MHRPRSRTAALATAAATLTAALALPAGAAADRDRDVTVMSRNLYLGADIIRAAGVPDARGPGPGRHRVFGIVRRTNFPLRATAIASGDRRRRAPDLIGLQEVALWRRTAARRHERREGRAASVYDFLAILQRRLRALGLHYEPRSCSRRPTSRCPTSRGLSTCA